jgi:predicted ArsR family transcriptional regulator
MAPTPRCATPGGAERLGVHPNTVRFHLDGLIATGRVEQVTSDATGPGRPAHLYPARREMDRNGPTSYRLLAPTLPLVRLTA